VPPANDADDTQSQQDTPATDDHLAARIDTMLSAAIEKAVPQLAARLGQLAGTSTPNTSAPGEPDIAKKVKKSKHTKAKAKRTHKSPDPTDASDSDTASDKHDSKPARKKRKRSKSSKQNKRKRATSESSDTDDSSGKSSSDSENDDDDGLPSEEEGTQSRPSFGYKIGETVSKKLRKKILSHQFVELIELLPQAESSKSLVLTTTNSNSVKLARKTTTKHITLEQWNEAFLIYMATYVDSAKTAKEKGALIKDMLTYYRDINTMAKKHYMWRDYDRTFRKDRAAHRHPATFDTIRHDLMLDARTTRNDSSANQSQNRPFRQKGTGNRPAAATSHIPTGYCINFHLPDRRCHRQPCKFKHNCPNCNNFHPSFLCNSNNKQTAPQQQTTSQPRPAPQPQKPNGSQAKTG